MPRTAQIQRATMVTGPWSTLVTLTAIENGIIRSFDKTTGQPEIAGLSSDRAVLKNEETREVNKILQMPDVREKIANGGATTVGGSAEDFAAFVRADYARWGRIVKDSGIKLE
jgi:hypothetical protein